MIKKDKTKNTEALRKAISDSPVTAEITPQRLCVSLLFHFYLAILKNTSVV